jgi:hypothetical protein
MIVMDFLAKSETAESPQVNQDETRLLEIRNRRRIAEVNFNDACVNVSKHREVLARANGAMEKARREFHRAEEEESSELMRLGLKR